MFKYGFIVMNSRITIHMYIILLKFDVFFIHPSTLPLYCMVLCLSRWKPSGYNVRSTSLLIWLTVLANWSKIKGSSGIRQHENTSSLVFAALLSSLGALGPVRVAIGYLGQSSFLSPHPPLQCAGVTSPLCHHGHSTGIWILRFQPFGCLPWPPHRLHLPLQWTGRVWGKGPQPGCAEVTNLSPRTTSTFLCACGALSFWSHQDGLRCLLESGSIMASWGQRCSWGRVEWSKGSWEERFWQVWVLAPWGRVEGSPPLISRLISSGVSGLAGSVGVC